MSSPFWVAKVWNGHHVSNETQESNDRENNSLEYQGNQVHRFWFHFIYILSLNLMLDKNYSFDKHLLFVPCRNTQCFDTQTWFFSALSLHELFYNCACLVSPVCISNKLLLTTFLSMVYSCWKLCHNQLTYRHLMPLEKNIPRKMVQTHYKFCYMNDLMSALSLNFTRMSHQIHYLLKV